MRITIHARVESVAGAAAREVEIGAIDRADDSDPASGLGLLLREAHVLLAALQNVMLDEQVTPLAPLTARTSRLARGFDSLLALERLRTGSARGLQPVVPGTAKRGAYTGRERLVLGVGVTVAVLVALGIAAH